MSAVESFKEGLTALEDKLGKYVEVKASVENVIPKNSNGIYTQSKIWVELPSQWLFLFQGPDKWGNEFTSIALYAEKPEGEYIDMSLGKDCEEVDELLEQLEVSIEEIADALYYSTHFVVDRVIDLENIQDLDIRYLEECLAHVKEAQEEAK